MDIVWGPEIEIDGKRPQWLDDDSLCQPCWNEYGWYEDVGAAARCVSGWNIVTKLRLPADHPYYKRPTATEDAGPFVTVRQMTEDEAQALARANDWSTVDALRSLGLIREETALDRYFSGKAMTAEERKAVEEYAAWMEENSK